MSESRQDFADDEAEERMIERLDTVALADTNRVRIYRMCQNCLDTVRIYGPGEVTRDPEFYMV